MSYGGINNQVLQDALFAVADGYCVINLSKNYVPGVMYQVVDGKKYNLNEQLGLPENSSLPALVKEWAKTIPEDGLEDFYKQFDREELIKRFSNGERHISFKYWTRTATFEKMLAEDHMALYRDPESDDIMAINYVIDRAVQNKLEERNSHLESLLKLEREYSGLLSALGKIYDEIYFIDLKNNTYETFSNKSFSSVDKKSGYLDYRSKKDYLSKVSGKYQSVMSDFLDISTLQKRLTDTDCITIEYQTILNSWYRGSYIVKKRDDNNLVVNALYVLQKIDKEKNLEKYYIDEIEEKTRVLSGLSLDYSIAFILNLDSDEYKIVFNQATNNAKTRNEIKSFTKYVEDYTDKFILPEYKDEFRKALDHNEILKRFETEDEFYFSFEIVPNAAGLSFFQAHVVKRYDNDKHFAILGFRSVDESINKERTYRKDLMEKTIALESEKRANKNKSEFLSRMSHDIRTPLNAILGFATLMQKEKDINVINEQLKKIETSGTYLLSILNNILDMAAIDSGEISLDEHTFILDENIDFSFMFKRYIDEKKITYSQSISFKHQYVIGDKTKIDRVLYNLISNSIKYTPENGRVNVEIKENDSDKEGYGKFEIVVTDDGIGMTQEFQQYMFESFTRERDTTSSKVYGSGLGLSIVKKIVDLMQGEIVVKSNPGSGTSFCVTFELKIADAPDENLKKEAIVDNVSFEGKRILLAEDNDLNAEIAIAILEEMGFLCERAADGIICVDMLQKAESGYYDLILMDIQMPNMDGYRASQTIRNLQDKVKSNIPIIAMTANAFDEDKKKAYAHGMNGHLAKPISIDELVNTLKQNLK